MTPSSKYFWPPLLLGTFLKFTWAKYTAIFVIHTAVDLTFIVFGHVFPLKNHRAIFKWLSQVIMRLQLLRLVHWLNNLVPVFQPLRSKSKTNRSLHARYFSCFEQVTINCLEFWFVHRYVCSCCDWLEYWITLALVFRQPFKKKLLYINRLISTFFFLALYQDLLWVFIPYVTIILTNNYVKNSPCLTRIYRNRLRKAGDTDSVTNR